MGDPAVDWAAAGLQEDLQAEWPGAQVQVVAHTGSTNTDLLSWDPSTRGVRVLLAEDQTAGRGRQGRAWVSRSGASLTFSVALPLRPQQGWGALSLVVGESVAQVLQPWTPPQDPPAGGRLMLKWPNDLWWIDPWAADGDGQASPRKLGGILIETVAMTGSAMPPGTRWTVIGLGLNLEPVDHADAACVRDIPPIPGSVDGAQRLWHALVSAMLTAVRRFEQDGFAPFAQRVDRRDVLRGQVVRLSAGALPEGVAIGIDPDGALRVRAPSGEEHRVVAGEVSARPGGGARPSG